MTDEQQPKALRLAKILEDHYFYADTNEAAAELRRLHAENDDFRATCEHLLRQTCEQIGEIVALKEQRDELLEALLRIADTSANQSGTGAQWVHWVDQARAVISKVGGAA